MVVKKKESYTVTMPVADKESNKDIFFEEDDLPYEEDILRNPFTVKCWLRYLEHKKDGNKQAIYTIYERAVKELPGSYKLWYGYLKIRRRNVKGKCVTDPAYEDANSAHERALVFMNKMPRIWIDYATFLMEQGKITRTRQVFDRALRALPITQHNRIWPIYLKFVRMYDLKETAIRVYRRYLKLCKENTEEYIAYVKSIGWLDEAAKKLADIINDDTFVSKEGKSKHQLWNELCDLIAKNPDKVSSLDIEPIIRQGLKRYSDQIGLWNELCDLIAKNPDKVTSLDIEPIIRQGLKRYSDQIGLWNELCDLIAKNPDKVSSLDIEPIIRQGLKRYSDQIGLWNELCDLIAKNPDKVSSLDIEPIIRQGLKRYSDQIGLWNELCDLIAKNPDKVSSLDIEPIIRQGLKRYSDQIGLWNELCDLIAKNPDKVSSLDIEPIIRQGLKRYSDQIGVLWNSMADYYIRGGHFQRACDIYEEAIQTVITVRDFTQVFDAYAQFEKNIISAKMESMAEEGPTDEDDLDVELMLSRLESLMDRRPLLLNSVLLRQNPHNVHEWHKRVKLFEGKPREIITTYTEAVQTVDPKIASGKPHTLWCEFAKFYETNDQVEDARLIFEKAVQVGYKYVDDLASVYCEWAEMEIRHENYEEALKIMQKATTPPPRKVAYHDESETVQSRVHKSLKVWSLYADLEESFGTFKTCKTVYDRIIDLRIATPQIIMNYGLFLEESNYFEEAFKAYEKGIALFRWPNVYDLWNTYLTKFMDRYGGSKLERARDLFEQCLENCPAKFSKAIYLLYAKLEEEHGLARHAMAVYDRATQAVLPEEQYEMFNVYLKRAAELYGVTYTRPIYEKAIEVLTHDQAREMCLRFADLERKLGEIDRARAIYAHCSQMCDPRSTAAFWQTWKEFEIKHGNEDTVREMLRLKRSVQAMYNTQVNFMSAQMLAVASGQENQDGGEKDEMQKLEEKARQMAEEAMKDQPPKPDKGILFVRSNTTDEELGEMTKTTNPDEINIDEDFSSDEDEAVEEVQQIPTEVYGSLANEDD